MLKQNARWVNTDVINARNGVVPTRCGHIVKWIKSVYAVKATRRALQPQRVPCLLFFRLFTRPFQSWMNLAIPLFRRQLPLHVKP